MKMWNLNLESYNRNQRKIKAKKRLSNVVFTVFMTICMSYFFGHMIAAHFRSLDRATISQECVK